MSDVEDNEAVHIQLNHDSSDSEDENNQIRIQIQADSSSSEEEQEPAPVPFRTGLYQPQIPHTIQILPNETPEQTHQRLFEENQLKTIQSEQIAMQIRGQNFEQLQIQRRLQYEQNQAADLEERRQMQEEYQRQVTEKFGPPPASVLESYAAEKNKNNNNHHHHNNNNNAEPWDDSTLDQLQNRNRGNVSADEQKLMKLRQQHEHGGNNNNNYYQNNNNNRNYNNNNYQQNRNHNNNNNNRNHHNNNYQQQQQQQQPHVYYPQSSHTFLQPTPAPSQHRPHNNYDPNLVALHNLNHHQQQQQQQHHPSYQMPAYQASFAATVHNNYDLVPTSPAYQPPFSAQSTPPERRLIPSKQEEKREFLAQHTAATLAAVVAAANGGVPGALLTPPPPPPPPLEETPDRLRIKDNPFIKQSRMRYITRGIVNIDLTNIKTVEDCDDAVTVLTADLSPYDGLILSDPEEIPELQLNPEPTTKNNNTTDEVQNKPDSEQSPESSQTTAPDLVTDDNNNNNNNLVNVDQGSTQSPSPTGMADGLVAISTSPTDEPFISKKAKEEEEKRLKEEEKRKKEEEKKATEAAAKKAKEDEKKATEAAAKKAKEDKKAADAATKKAKEDEKKAKEDEIKRKKEEEKRKKEEEKLAKKNKGKSPEGTIAVTAAGAAVVGVNNNNNNPETDPQLQQQQQPDKEPSISHKQNDGTENEPSISRQSSETSVINSVLAAGGPNAPCTLPYHDTDFPQPITFEQATIILKSQQPHKIPSKFQKANVFGTSGFRKPDHITCYFYQHLWDTDYDPTNRAHVLLLNAFYMYMNDLVITPNFNNDPLNKGNERPVQCEIPEPTGSHWKDTLRVPNEEQPWSELQGTPARYTILRPLEQDLRPSILTLYLALYLIEGAPNEILKKVVIALLRQFFSRDNAPSAMSYLEIFVPISYVINSLIMSNTTVHAEPFYRMFYKCNLKKEFGQWIPFEDYTLNGFLLAITEYMFVLPLTFWFRHLIQQYDFPTLVCAVRQRLLSNIKLEFDRLDTEYCKGGYATYYHEVMHDNYLAQDLKVVFAEQKKQKHLLTPLEAQIHMNQQQRGPGRNSISYTAPNPTTTTTDETAPKQNKIGPNIVVGKSSTATTAITVTTEPPASPTSSSSPSSTAGPESPATTTTTATTNQTPKARSGPPALKVVANIQRQRAAAAAAKSSTEATAAAATTTDNAIGHDDSGNNTNDDNTPQQDQEEAMNSDQDEDKEKQESSSPQQPHDDTSN